MVLTVDRNLDPGQNHGIHSHHDLEWGTVLTVAHRTNLVTLWQYVRSLMPSTCHAQELLVSYLDASDLTIGASSIQISHALTSAAAMRTLFCFWCDFSFDAWAALSMSTCYILDLRIKFANFVQSFRSSSLHRERRWSQNGTISYSKYDVCEEKNTKYVCLIMMHHVQGVLVSSNLGCLNESVWV